MPEIAISSRSIDDLHPRVAAMCHEFLATCSRVGIDVVIISTYRTVAAQNELYAQGRTMPGPIATKSRGGQSFHQYRVAFDFVPIEFGKAAWKDSRAFEVCGTIGETVGLEWAGRWTSIKETDHLQFTDGLTLADFQRGKMIASAPAPDTSAGPSVAAGADAPRDQA